MGFLGIEQVPENVDQRDLEFSVYTKFLSSSAGPRTISREAWMLSPTHVLLLLEAAMEGGLKDHSDLVPQQCLFVLQCTTPVPPIL